MTTEESNQLKSLDDVEVEDVFYKSNEYNRLPQEAKTKLFLLRKQRGDDSSKGHSSKKGKGNRKRGRGNANDSGKNSSRNAIKKLKQRIAALGTEKETDNEKEVRRSQTAHRRKVERVERKEERKSSSINVLPLMTMMMKNEG